MKRTKIDELFAMLEKHKKISFREARKELGLTLEEVERLGIALEKKHMVEVYYPLNIFSQPKIILRYIAQEPKEIVKRPEGSILEKYVINERDGHVYAEVEIIRTKYDKKAFYYITIPKMSAATEAYLEYIKDEISKKLPPETSETGEMEKRRNIYKNQCIKTELLLAPFITDPAYRRIACGMVGHSMYGLEDLEYLMADDWLEEIVVNNALAPVIVFHRKYGWMRTNLTINSEITIANYSSKIGRKIGRQITNLAPILDAHIISGERVNATLAPISTRGNTLTIRKFARNPWTITNLVKPEFHTLSVEMAALIWQAVQYEMNIIIAGGTASGKTTMLNCAAALIQPHHRIISIEDTREMMLPAYQWNWVPMVTRVANPEGFGEVNMLDLMVNALRMRPDRILVGEIRKRKEAEVLFEAMHTGHSVYSTIHADRGIEVMRRLTEPPIDLPPVQVEAVHLIVVQYRDRRKNIRRTLEISEIISGVEKPELNKLFLWNARSDKFQAVHPPRRYTEQMNLHTGMTEREIFEDQEKKGTIIKWMMNNELTRVNDVGAVMKFYYSDEEDIYRAAEKGEKPSRVLALPSSEK